MSTARYLHTRIDPGPQSLVLAAGDLIAIVVFAGLGAAHHGGTPLADPMHVGWIAAPFLIGWAIAAFIGGLYTRDAILTPRRALSWTIPAWIVATLIGQALRATPLFPGGTALTFVLVTVGAGGGLVLGWRVLATLLLAK